MRFINQSGCIDHVVNAASPSFLDSVSDRFDVRPVHLGNGGPSETAEVEPRTSPRLRLNADLIQAICQPKESLGSQDSAPDLAQAVSDHDSQNALPTQ